MHDEVRATVALRARTVADDDAIETAAMVYAVQRGVDVPRAGNSIYERGLALHTLLITCSDPESPDETPAPFFQGIDEISSGLDHDRIELLVAAQALWQDQCGARKRSLMPSEVLDKAQEIAAATTEQPYIEMSPGLQWSMLHALSKIVTMQVHNS